MCFLKILQTGSGISEFTTEMSTRSTMSRVKERQGDDCEAAGSSGPHISRRKAVVLDSPGTSRQRKAKGPQPNQTLKDNPQQTFSIIQCTSKQGASRSHGLPQSSPPNGRNSSWPDFTSHPQSSESTPLLQHQGSP